MTGNCSPCVYPLQDVTPVDPSFGLTFFDVSASSVLQCTPMYSSVLQCALRGGNPPNPPPPPVLLVLLVPLVLLLVLVLPVLLVLLILPCSKQSNFQNTMVENNANHGIFASPKPCTTMYYYVLPVLLVLLILPCSKQSNFQNTVVENNANHGIVACPKLCTTMYYYVLSVLLVLLHQAQRRDTLRTLELFWRKCIGLLKDFAVAFGSRSALVMLALGRGSRV